MSDNFPIMSPDMADPARIDQQWELLKQEADEVASVLQALIRKVQAAADGGDTAAGGWLNDLKVLATLVRKEQAEMQSFGQARHGFAAQSPHELAARDAAAQPKSAPSAGGVDPYAVVPDLMDAPAPAPAVDPYAVVPDVPYVPPPKPAVDPYAVVMDHPNRDEPIPPWYREAPAGSASAEEEPTGR